METENNQIPNHKNPFAKEDKVVFIEYSSAAKGQHFMTVMTNVQGKKMIIGRIFRTYDATSKKYTYTAVDRSGVKLFEPTQNLYELKKEFITHRKTLLMTIPENPVHKKDKELDELEQDRQADLNEIRNRNTDKDKEKGIER